MTARRALFLAMPAVPLVAGAATAQPNSPLAALPGSWEVLYRPDPGGPFEGEFRGLWSFGVEGLLLATDQPPVRRSLPDGSRPLFGLGHGAWRSDGDGFVFLFRQHAAPVALPSALAVVITVRGRLGFGASLEAWTGQFLVVAEDPSGAPLARGAGQLNARAILP